MTNKVFVIKQLLILIVIIFLAYGQPSRHKDTAKLSNQFMKKKQLCNDSICASSGKDFLFTSRLSSINMHSSLHLTPLFQISLRQHYNRAKREHFRGNIKTVQGMLYWEH